MTAQQFSILIVVLPLLVAPVIVIANRPRFAWWMTFATVLACLYMAAVIVVGVLNQSPVLYELGGWAPPWGIEYRVDSLNGLVCLIVAAIGAMTMLFARNSVEKEIPHHLIPMFYAAFLLCYLGLLGITLTGDIFNLFVFLEISSLASYALIALGKTRKALTASFHYLVLGTLGATFFLIGVGFLYAATGTLNMAQLANILPQLNDPELIFTAFAFITVGIALKAAIYPLHLWLPNAYTYAPSVISVFLSATATKVAVYVLVRCLFGIFGVPFLIETSFPALLMVFGIVGILYGAVRAIQATGLKKMLAYSSVSQVGYMVLGMGFVTQLGVSATLLHLFNHALMKAALFMAAGMFIYRANTASFTDLKGIAHTMPWTFVAMMIAALSLIGIPGTVGFISKWQLLQAAMAESSWAAVLFILVGSLLAVIYVWKIVEALYFTKQDKTRVRQVNSADSSVVATPATMGFALWVCALACIYFGISPELTYQLATSATEALFITTGGL